MDRVNILKSSLNRLNGLNSLTAQAAETVQAVGTLILLSRFRTFAD
jgi:hypothetical protein